MPLPPSSIPLLCEAAARALRCTAHLSLPDGRAASSGDAHAGATACLELAHDARATLRLERPEGAAWTDAERALATTFARLAAELATEDATRGAVERELRTANERLERSVSESAAALHRSETRFRRLVEHGSDLLMISAPDGALTYVSPSAERLLGYAPEEMVGRKPADMLHPDDRCGLEDALRTPEDGGAETRTSWRIRHQDGGWREFEALARALPADSGERGHVINARDVTERRVAEERFRRMIENGSDLLLISRLDGRLTYASPSVERLLGWTPHELITALPTDMLHPDDVARTMDAMWRCGAEPGTIRRVDFRVRHRDGSWRHIEAMARSLDPDSGDAGIVCNGRDVTEQRAAEEALQRSEARFRRLIENGSDLLMISAPDGALTYVSPSVERLLGLHPSELLGKRPTDLVHPDDLPALWDCMQRMLGEPGSVHASTWRVRHRNGDWRRIEALGRTILPDSAAEGIVANGRDVTEQRAAEEALQRSEEHFRRLIENGSDLLMISRPDGPLTYVSPSVERILGYAPEWMLGKVPSELTHPDDLDAVWDTLARVAANPGSVHPMAIRLRHADGSWRHLEGSLRTVAPDSADEGLVANSRDVTEQRAAERALQESEAKYRSVVDAAQDMITVIDAEGIVRFQSPSAERILGFAPEEMVGRNVMDFLHPDDRAMAVERLGRVMTHPGSVECVQYRSRCRDGSFRYMESTGRTILPDSAAAGAVGIVRDVTARMEAEAALRQAKADAEQAHREAERANRAKSEFLSRMSHELRTPLNSILGFAQVLEDVELAPEYRTGVGHILRGGRHLLDLINEVLDLARIETDPQPMPLERVRVEAAVREAVDMVRPLALARGIRIAAELGAAGEHFLLANRQRLTQVLLNLLSNAVKYNREGGEVRIDAEARHDGRVRLRVRDEGAGIAPEQQEQLFVPFARLGAERTGVEGTGLGLALSQRLAQAMGGTLFLERSGPAGSTFSIELPAAAADPHGHAPTLDACDRPVDDAAPTPATLLYIEDNPANLTLVETVLLRHREWRVLAASLGRLGIEMAHAHAPDVILLDLHLPDMHGTDVLRALRADARTADTPVLVVSADATPRTVDALLAAGADAYVTKPLDVRAFVATLERLLVRAPRAA